jgi:probable F420-dependent oxidoreductase
MPPAPSDDHTENLAPVRIGIGIASNPFSDPSAFWRWVDLCEGSGVDSLWQTDRQVSSQPHLEAMSVMASLAGATSRMRFGMNAVVVSLRDPLLLAKQCATIDYLSGGRLLPVFGVGNESAPEWRATGRSPKGRGKRADEALEVMRRLWVEESVDFEGEYYRYRGASIAPRPVQRPLPLWIGGSSAAAVRRTVRYGTGWLAGIQTPDQAQQVIAAIKAESQVQGREIADDHYGAGFAFRFGSWQDEVVARAARGPLARDYLCVGGAPAILRRILDYRRAGVSKFVLIPLARGDADLLDQTRRLVAEVLPVAHANRFTQTTRIG